MERTHNLYAPQPFDGVEVFRKKHLQPSGYRIYLQRGDSERVFLAQGVMIADQVYQIHTFPVCYGLQESDQLYVYSDDPTLDFLVVQTSK